MAKRQLAQFLKSLKASRHTTACADHWWLRDVAELKSKANDLHTLVMDVGCNKAYFSAAALNHLAPGYGNHLQLFFKSHLARGIYTKPCGTCNECKQGKPIGAGGKRKGAGHLPPQATVDVHCFEPSEVHVASLVRARDALYGPPLNDSGGGGGAAATAAGAGGHGRAPTTRVNFHVRHSAVSNATGTAFFPANCTVNTCSVGRAASRSSSSSSFEGSSLPAFTDTSSDSAATQVVPVHLTTVDAELAALGHPSVDVLKIDTEGFDPAVLAGAYRALSAHRIGVLSFEYHNLWSRTGASLRQCVTYLEAMGYACYYDAAVLARISGGCWADGYELRHWSNVVCAVAGSQMDAVLLAGSYLAEGELALRA